jgi:hypothetical protein
VRIGARRRVPGQIAEAEIRETSLRRSSANSELPSYMEVNGEVKTAAREQRGPAAL